MTRIGLAAAAAFIGGLLPYIEAVYPLQSVVAESEIVAGVVEKTDHRQKTGVVKVTKSLKGKPAYSHVRINLGAGWNDWQREEAVRHLVPGATVVIFDGIRTGQVAPSGDKRKALIYANRFFMKFSGTREDRPEKEVWNFEQIEIMLNRSFNGTAEELSAVILGSLSGKQKFPVPDLRIPSIRKEDVAALPPPGVKVAEAQLPPPFRRSGAVALRAPENPAKVAPGLRFEYYEGTWKEIPDFGKIAPAVKGVTPSLDPSERRRDKDVALRFTGFLEAPRDGTYVFSASGGVHRLFFGKVELALLVEQHPVDVAIDLKAGRHAITVAFADAGKGGPLKMWWQVPGLAKQSIPASVLFHGP